jgi:dTMP kinase
MRQKFYYILEGSDGCGKSTSIQQVYNKLYSMMSSRHVLSRDVLLTREPGALDPVCQQIRTIVKSGLKVDPLCELMLFMADRAQHREMVVKPALARGSIVLQDRGFISSLAYQHYGRGRPLELIKQLNTLTMSDIFPTKIIWIDTPLSIALPRITHRVDSFEAKEFQERVYAGYSNIYDSGDYPMVRVNGDGTVADISEEIVDIIMQDHP